MKIFNQNAIQHLTILHTKWLFFSHFFVLFVCLVLSYVVSCGMFLIYLFICFVLVFSCVTQCLFLKNNFVVFHFGRPSISM
jgi:hypothetical protein